jgi:TonB family protein
VQLFKLTLISFLLGAASLCAAQEPKQPTQETKADSSAKEPEKPKGEVTLALEELSKRGEIVLGSRKDPESSEDSGDAEKLITSGVINGKAVELVQPPYPAIARASRASGKVDVLLIIDKEGNVMAAEAVSGHPLLFGAALRAARASRFTPTKLDGQPVHVLGKLIYNFVTQ